MQESWDWSTGEKEILDRGQWPQEVQWCAETCFSPDGEEVGSIVYMGEGEFNILQNTAPWSESVDNAWFARYSPDGRLTVLTSSMGSWTLRVQDQAWPEEYEYIWDTRFSQDGGVITAAIKKEGAYAMAMNGEAWEHQFVNATGFTLSENGRGAACVVQTASLDEGDIEGFAQGIFSVALNGQTWDKSFLNVWDPVIDAQGERTAAVVRLNRQEYSIAVDSQPWEQTFNMAWDPCFNPVTGQVLAPVKTPSGWSLAQDEEIVWEGRFLQLWQQKICSQGRNIAAIAAPEFGQFSVVQNDKPWKHTYPVLTDLTLSPQGERAAAIGRSGWENMEQDPQLGLQQWQVVVDDQPWEGWWDRIFQPVFSQDGQHLALRAESQGKYTLLLDNRAYPRQFSMLWDPVFSPDGRKILIRARQGDKYLRIVADLDDFK
ncbi:MAG: electron transfer complex subunit TmcD [Desulfohalobiaceae bacterium]